MAGTIFGLGLSQQFDVNGDPLSGGLLYLYAANSSTPVVAYKNFGLTAGQEQPWPMELDSTGRIPAFWVADGSYRVRLTDADGLVQFDHANIEAIGASSGGGGGGDTTDPNSVLSVGDVKWRPGEEALGGWVRMNGRTIGSTTSGASERANADCQTLFEYIWNNFSQTLAPVVSGRGGSANADWLANKQITLLDMRGRAPFGLDDMGNTAAGFYTGISFGAGDATTGGSKGGAPLFLMARSAMPNIQLNIPAGQGSHHHSIDYLQGTASGGGGVAISNILGAASTEQTTDNTLPAMLTESLNGAVTQTSVPNISPFVLGTWYWRL